jgi:hypothetical protein
MFDWMSFLKKNSSEVPYPLLRIRDIYPGSEFFHPGSRVKKKIPDPVFFTKKLFLSSRKNDLGCSPRIRIPRSGFSDFFSSRIPFSRTLTWVNDICKTMSLSAEDQQLLLAFPSFQDIDLGEGIRQAMFPLFQDTDWVG